MFFGATVHAQEVISPQVIEVAPSELKPVAVPEPQPVPEKKPLTNLEAIQATHKLLTTTLQERLKEEKQPYSLPNLTNPIRVTFAVWNQETGDINLYYGLKSGTSLTMTTPGAPAIKVTVTNKIYSQYSIPPETKSIVAGVIYPVVTTSTTSSKVKSKKTGKLVTVRSSKYSALDTVYIPYSNDYYTPEILSAGSDYLSFLIQEAYDELRAKNIHSRAFPDRLLSDTIDPYLVKTIAVIEQSDHRTLLGDTEPERAVGRFLIKLATNQENAFSSALSTAGAAGMVQFIPSTYAMMVRNRPDLGLIPDFRTGMSDHKNAVKAQVAYLDEELAVLPTSVRALYPTEKLKAGAFMAAAYNGGSPRVRKAIAAYGDAEWDILHHQKRGKLTPSSLRSETVTYVKKLRKTYSMFEAGYFATPKAPSGALPTQEALALHNLPPELQPARQVAILTTP